jgi:hypothetical protein
VLINDIAPFTEGGDSFMCTIWPLTGRNDFVARFWQEIYAKQEDEVCSEMKAN